jgi:hypothetical protein
MPTHGNLRYAYALASRKFLLHDADMLELTKPFMDRLDAKEFSLRRRDNSLFSKILDDALFAVVSEIDHSDLTEFTKKVIRVIFSPVLKEKRSPDVDIVEKAFEAITVDESVDQVEETCAAAATEPIVQIDNVEERSVFQDALAIGKVIMENVPELATVKTAVQVAGAAKRTYDKIKSGTPTGKAKKTPPKVVRMSELPVVSTYEHDTTLGEFLGETGEVVSPQDSVRRQNIWDTHSSQSCAACKHIVERSWPKMSSPPSGKRLKAIAFFHGALNLGMCDVGFEFDRVKDRPSHWYNTTVEMTRDLLSEDKILGESDSWC